MFWIMGYLVVTVAAVALLFLMAAVFGRGESTPPLPATGVVQAHNAEALASQDPQRVADQLTFELVLRGYRPDQVDPVIEQLLADNQRLREQLAATGVTADSPRG